MARIVGLTGGIASGKSTVASMFRDLGAPIVDADRVAREVVEPGTAALAEIAERFGPEVLAAGGRLDRKRLGAIIFGDDEARRALNAITHPRIRAASEQQIAALLQDGAPVVIYEASLLVERGALDWLDALIVVAVPEEVQIARLIERDGIDGEAARARLAAQLPLEDKVALADYVVDNAGTLEDTRAQVADIWERIREQR